MLTPLHDNKVNTYPIIAFDTEDNSAGTVTLIDFCWKESGVIKHFTTKKLEAAIQFIYSRKSKSIFVAHNLEYDIINIFRDFNYKQIKRLTYTGRLISGKLEKLPHIFIDSYNFFPGSLAKMGEVVGIKKGKMDVESIEYVQGDTEILFAFMDMLQAKINRECNLEIGATIGKLAMGIFRKHYLKRDFTPFNEEIAVKSYYGGRCELFWKGEIEGDIRYVDVNSMYPDAMKNRFPDTDTIIPVDSIDYEFGFADCTVHVSEDMFLPPLPARSDSGLCFPVGKFRGCWTFHELKYAMSLGVELVELHEAYGTDIGCEPFNNFVDVNYELRLSSTTDFNTTFYKLVLNNLYGKFSQRNPHVECRNKEMPLWEEEKTGAILIRVLGELYFYEFPMSEPPVTANFAWGTYITSYARIKWHKIASECHRVGTILYGDTDSVLYLHKGVDPDIELHPTKLGALKEERYKFANFVMPKGYILQTLEGKWKVACKGVPLPREFDKEKVGTMDNPQLQFLLGGETTVKKPVRLRESLVTGELANNWRDVEKHSISIYKRRKVVGIGPTQPRTLQELIGVA